MFLLSKSFRTFSPRNSSASRMSFSPSPVSSISSDLDSSKVTYENPLVGRYSSKEMSYIWSPQKKFSTWRRMWVALAQAQHELGLKAISKVQIDQMRQNLDNINWDVAAAKEKELRHDVMAHIHAFGQLCPEAMPIIHLGATSCDIGDNTDLIQIKDALEIIHKQLLNLLDVMKHNALLYKNQPTLGFTHYQPAQLTTVGKRMTLWMQDFLFDLHQVEYWLENLPFRGIKGTTGTQASFLKLFNGDHEKCRALDRRVAELMGFKERSIAVTGQTYTRKIDFLILSALSGIAQSAHKMATDIRLLMNLREIDEPFEEKQVGSSAMAYKRNPMRSERICSLARFVMSLTENAAQTHANQWFERTLDDSANRRLSLPESFLGTDVILRLATNVINNIKVWPLVIRKNIDSELPFMATENILMAAVNAGGDRQHLHEVIRTHSMEAARLMKAEGKPNDLIQRIKNDAAFAAVKDQLDGLLDPIHFIGRSSQQVDEFITENVDPVLISKRHLLESFDRNAAKEVSL